VPTQRVQQRGIGIDRADRFDLLGEGFWVIRFGLGIEPIPAAMGLKRGLPLKIVPPTWAKSREQSGV
jgi:hypothetical protein